jgi:hypothetical protein
MATSSPARKGVHQSQDLHHANAAKDVTPIGITQAEVLIKNDASNRKATAEVKKRKSRYTIEQSNELDEIPSGMLKASLSSFEPDVKLPYDRSKHQPLDPYKELREQLGAEDLKKHNRAREKWAEHHHHHLHSPTPKVAACVVPAKLVEPTPRPPAIAPVEARIIPRPIAIASPRNKGHRDKDHNRDRDLCRDRERTRRPNDFPQPRPKLNRVGNAGKRWTESIQHHIRREKSRREREERRERDERLERIQQQYMIEPPILPPKPDLHQRMLNHSSFAFVTNNHKLKDVTYAHKPRPRHTAVEPVATAAPPQPVYMMATQFAGPAASAHNDQGSLRIRPRRVARGHESFKAPPGVKVLRKPKNTEIALRRSSFMKAAAAPIVPQIYRNNGGLAGSAHGRNGSLHIRTRRVARGHPSFMAPPGAKVHKVPRNRRRSPTPVTSSSSNSISIQSFVTPNWVRALTNAKKKKEAIGDSTPAPPEALHHREFRKADYDQNTRRERVGDKDDRRRDQGKERKNEDNKRGEHYRHVRRMYEADDQLRRREHSKKRDYRHDHNHDDRRRDATRNDERLHEREREHRHRHRDWRDGDRRDDRHGHRRQTSRRRDEEPIRPMVPPALHDPHWQRLVVAQQQTAPKLQPRIPGLVVARPFDGGMHRVRPMDVRY